LVTKHYRCGELIGEIGNVDPYKFDNQQTYNLQKPIKFLPGDMLITECEYDTSTSEVSIVGGEETTDEMCLNFIGVYPKPATEDIPSLLEVCMSYNNGIDFNGRQIPGAFAIGATDRLVVETEYEIDPALNIGSCCDATGGRAACEALYISKEGGACAEDPDCEGNLVCSDGLCSEEVATNAPTNAPTGSPTDSSSARSCPPLSTFLVPILASSFLSFLL